MQIFTQFFRNTRIAAIAGISTLLLANGPEAVVASSDYLKNEYGAYSPIITRTNGPEDRPTRHEGTILKTAPFNGAYVTLQTLEGGEVTEGTDYQVFRAGEEDPLTTTSTRQLALAATAEAPLVLFAIPKSWGRGEGVIYPGITTGYPGITNYWDNYWNNERRAKFYEEHPDYETPGCSVHCGSEYGRITTDILSQPCCNLNDDGCCQRHSTWYGSRGELSCCSGCECVPMGADATVRTGGPGLRHSDPRRWSHSLFTPHGYPTWGRGPGTDCGDCCVASIVLSAVAAVGGLVGGLVGKFGCKCGCCACGDGVGAASWALRGSW